VFRVRGIPVRVDSSWFLIAGLLLFYVYQRLASALDDRGMVAILGAAAATTVLFFASILAHELGHALTSLDRKIPVTGITLFLMGGVTESREEARTARDEFVIVGIGPFISLVLAAVFGLVRTATVGMPVVTVVAGYLAWINLALAIFNVLPGYPLDGGRMLRAILWGVTGYPHRATRWAARVGQAFALAFGAFGLVSLISPSSSGLGGLWEILLAMFLFRGATEAHARARVRERFAARKVRDRMGSIPASLDPGLPLDQALRLVQERPSLPWPVGTPLQGILTLGRIDAVPSRDWAYRRVGDVALPLDGRTVRADATMDAALDALAEAPEHVLVVTDDGRAVGLLTPSLVGDR
jgi:Zn-dependent protease/CBS domain-containing protein